MTTFTIYCHDYIRDHDFTKELPAYHAIRMLEIAVKVMHEESKLPTLIEFNSAGLFCQRMELENESGFLVQRSGLAPVVVKVVVFEQEYSTAEIYFNYQHDGEELFNYAIDCLKQDVSVDCWLNPMWEGITFTPCGDNHQEMNA